MGSGWAWPIDPNGEAIGAPFELKNVNVDGGMSFDAEYAEARASLPTVRGVAIPCPGVSLPCPSFEEVIVSVTPYLEITERGPDAYWVRCLSCHSWVMAAEGGSPTEVLEHAEEIHECVVAGRKRPR